MSIKYNETVTLEVIVCAACGIQFAMPADYITKRREDGAKFYCPNGHNLVFESEIEQLKKELAVAEKKSDLYRGYYKAEQSDHEYTRNRLRATKGQLTKTKKRVANGVCPCCNRTFQDLARHMAGQHPDFAQENE